ncbi:MAG: CPBP family intramembrane glutamic endopeptidase [Phycisphaerales bacterium]
MPRRPNAVRAGAAPASDGYFARSKQPLEILFFLLPLIVFYEIGLVVVLRQGHAVMTNRAHEALLRLFDVFGLDAAALSLPALSLPGVLLIVVLLAWQALARRPWVVDLRTVAIMAIESAVLAVPLFLAIQLVMQAFAQHDPTAAIAASVDGSTASPEASLRALSPVARVAISIGAGLYEELIFRMALIAVMHTLFVDAIGWKEKPSIALAVVISTIAFVLYHPLSGPHGAIEWRRVVSLTVIGLWFGGVFAFRGFGIVVGTHAAYDIAALMVE